MLQTGEEGTQSIRDMLEEVKSTLWKSATARQVKGNATDTPMPEEHAQETKYSTRGPGRQKFLRRCLFFLF